MSKRKLVLRSSEGESFEVEEGVVNQMKAIDGVIHDDVYPLPSVPSKTLAKIIEYCDKHMDDDPYFWDEDLKDWDAEFVKLDQSELCGLVKYAHELKVKSLVELICKAIAGMIVGKTPEEIRETFNIKNEYTPEEEEAVRKENKWAFE